MNIGYARVSTEDQELGSQVAELERAGCEVIYKDVVSGAKASRPELDKALGEIKEGDTFTVWKLDRLGRSVLHVTGLIEDFRKRGINFRSITEQINTKDALGVFIFHIFAVMAEFERGLISERTKASLKYLKDQGKVLGRPIKDRSGDAEQLERLRSEGLTVGEVCGRLGWNASRYFRTLKVSASGQQRRRRFKPGIGRSDGAA